jgi:hypothetical protein
MYDPVTGKKLPPLELGRPVGPYTRLRQLESIIELPERCKKLLADVDDLKARLERPIPDVLPLPPTSAAQDDFTAYQGSLLRFKADEQERKEAKSRIEALRGRGLPGSTPVTNAFRVLLSNRDKIIELINDALIKIVNKPKASADDQEKWKLLGEVYVALMRTGIGVDTYDLAYDYGKCIERLQNRERWMHYFRAVPLQVRWDDPALLFDRPEEAVTGLCLSIYTGLPPLHDVKLSREAGFRLLSVKEIIALSRYETVRDIKSGIPCGDEVPGDTWEYFKKQSEARGSAAIDWLFK